MSVMNKCFVCVLPARVLSPTHSACVTIFTPSDRFRAVAPGPVGVLLESDMHHNTLKTYLKSIKMIIKVSKYL